MPLGKLKCYSGMGIYKLTCIAGYFELKLTIQLCKKKKKTGFGRGMPSILERAVQQSGMDSSEVLE
jgi:hypothetical protein